MNISQASSFQKRQWCSLSQVRRKHFYKNVKSHNNPILVPINYHPDQSLVLENSTEVNGPKTFLIVGMRDGTVGRMDLQSGNIDYKVMVWNLSFLILFPNFVFAFWHLIFPNFQCHKGQVGSIRVNPEVAQFASMGSEPSIRIWKVYVNQEELFIPIFEITWKYPVHHVAVVRQAICFALSHHDSPTHKIAVFNTLETGNKIRLDGLIQKIISFFS